MKIFNAIVMLIGIGLFFAGLKGAGPTVEQDQALTIAGAILFAGSTIGMSVCGISPSIRKPT